MRSVIKPHLRAPLLIAAIALTWFDHRFCVLLRVLRERTRDVSFLIEAALIVASHETFVSTGID